MAEVAEVPRTEPARDPKLVQHEPHPLEPLGGGGDRHASVWGSVEGAAELLSLVKLVDTKSLGSLPLPWPRCQDCQDCHATPQADDLLVAVSHGWPYQAHPDPLGHKSFVVRTLAEVATETQRPMGRTLAFFDFLSVHQRPFLAGQAPRSLDEEKAFWDAVQVMPSVYLLADAVLHIEMPWSPVPGDGDRFVVGGDALMEMRLQEIGDTVQIVGRGVDPAMPFDQIASINGREIRTLEDIDVAVDAAEKDDGELCVEVIRRPFGRQNQLQESERGWIYLERFISMVKVAMLDETEASRVIFSNSPSVLRELIDGGARLRAAAMSGPADLQDLLEKFFEELNYKQFSKTSADAQQTELGMGHFLSNGSLPDITSFLRSESSCSENSDMHSVAPSSANSDLDFVRQLMQELVIKLPRFWDKQVKEQRKRQLVLAVGRGDAVACAQLLTARVDPDTLGERREAVSHIAARRGCLDVVRVLLEHGADASLLCDSSNCAVHVVLCADEATMQLLDLFASSRELLALRNSLGLSVIQRLADWATKAASVKPYAPAMVLVDLAQGILVDLFSPSWLRWTPGAFDVLFCRTDAARHTYLNALDASSDVCPSAAARVVALFGACVASGLIFNWRCWLESEFVGGEAPRRLCNNSAARTECT